MLDLTIPALYDQDCVFPDHARLFAAEKRRFQPTFCVLSEAAQYDKKTPCSSRATLFTQTGITLDQMGHVVRAMAGKRLSYQDLVAGQT